MTASQQLRLFIQERLAAAAEEIFGVVEKTIGEYEQQVVQLVDQLKQGVLQLNNTSSTQPHIQLCRIESQPVNEEVPPLQQLMKDETIQPHSPQVIVEQTSLTDLQPVSEEPVSLQQPNPRRQELMSSEEDGEAAQQPSPQVKEEQVVLSISIISDSDTSISNSGTNGFVTSETSSDGQPTIPFYPAIANHSVTNIRDIESGGSGLSFGQTDNNTTFGQSTFHGPHQTSSSRARVWPTGRRLVPAQCTPAERGIMETLGEMQLQLRHITAVVQNLESPRRVLPRERRLDLPSGDVTDDTQLPLLSMEDLDTLEEKLKSTETKNILMSRLSLSGGQTMKKVVWRICTKLFAPHLAVQLNWCGRGEKRGIRQTRVKDLIVSSALQNGVVTSEADTEKVIMEWLRLASDRLTTRRR